MAPGRWCGHITPGADPAHSCRVGQRSSKGFPPDHPICMWSSNRPACGHTRLPHLVGAIHVHPMVPGCWYAMEFLANLTHRPCVGRGLFKRPPYPIQRVCGHQNAWCVAVRICHNRWGPSMPIIWRPGIGEAMGFLWLTRCIVVTLAGIVQETAPDRPTCGSY